MKILKLFLLSLVVASTGIAQLEAMKRSEISGGFTTENHSATECHPIIILINHKGRDRSGAISEDLRTALRLGFVNQTKCQPIIIVSPSTVLKLLQELEEYEINQVRSILENIVFLDNPDDHFFVLFPKKYIPYLHAHKTCPITSQQQLEDLIKVKKKHPCKKEFETLVELCKTIENAFFKVYVTGHGNASRNEYITNDGTLITEDNSTICNLCIQDCSDMLECFNYEIFIIILLESCEIGANTCNLVPEINNPYSFHLAITGVSDVIAYHHLEQFLSAPLTTETMPQEIVSLLSKEIQTPDQILQLLPAGCHQFKIYETDKVAVIDQKTAQSNKSIDKPFVVIYGKITSPLVFSKSQGAIPLVYFMGNGKKYSFEKISLIDIGVFQFVKSLTDRNPSSRNNDNGSSDLPLQISIQELQGKDDTEKYPFSTLLDCHELGEITLKFVIINLLNSGGGFIEYRINNMGHSRCINK